MNLVKGIPVWLALTAYRLGRCWLAWRALALLVGEAWAALLLVLIAAARYNWLLRIGAFAALWRLWHWPWPVALIAAVPRLVLVLPGLFATARARLRHPRPLWTPPPAAAAAASAAASAAALPADH
jgi:hypothetical protein